MAWRKSRFPAEMARWLDRFGRYYLDPDSGLDNVEILDRMADLYFDSQRDPEGFAADLRAVVDGDTGGFAAIGGARLALDMYGSDYKMWPADAVAVLDAALEAKSQRRFRLIDLAPYEMDRVRDPDSGFTLR